MATKNDKQILQLKKEIEIKKSSIAKGEKFIPKTNMNLELFGIKYNLHISESNRLLFLKSFLASLNNDNIILGGYSTKDYINDLESKYMQKNIKQEQDRLDVLEAKLHNLLSNETKIALDLEEIKKSI